MTLDWLDPEMQALVPQLTEPQRVSATLYGEARREPIEGLVAVASVIRNRVQKGGWFGTSYSDVCLKAHQFSCWSPAGGAKNYQRLLAFVQFLTRHVPVTNGAERQCIGVALCVMQDYFNDNVKQSTHYHVATMAPRPSWAQGVTPAVQKGGHVFYNTIR